MRDRRLALNIVVAALAAAGVAAALWLPLPGWWPVGLQGYYPPLFVGLALFSAAGTLAYLVFAPGRPQRIVAICAWLLGALLAAASYNETLYRAIIRHEQPTTWAGGIYAAAVAAGYAGYFCLFGLSFMTGYLMLRWLFPRLLRTLRLDGWWNRAHFTVREFDATEDVFPIVTDWAQANGVNLANESDGERRYISNAKPYNEMAVFTLAVRQQSGKVTIEGGIAMGGAPRFMSLGFVPAVAPLASGGLAGAIPRKNGRRLANDLLTRLGAAPIE
jgi:hypothetical protein